MILKSTNLLGKLCTLSSMLSAMFTSAASASQRSRDNKDGKQQSFTAVQHNKRQLAYMKMCVCVCASHISQLVCFIYS